ncbi:hypothetical protein [Mesorhizobium amorphae]|uniref:Uncharacterized protein n=1 Tax=Mesorhizobium amorphae CCNWGS0123 TaxID=1082933 RepID=G6YD71_9HYPH|nr:hypothetical protein [Mesorhizobium amorphae]ANT49101.1 hypothetical protein A6B35_03705 [Mesorhizobium amorphae CCNWGS0123]EHH10311.1 hypothetical protein MEA186_19540 [Mesorhizobium amorphae CCNWGS0123]GLR43153.1 hypothetical protein GCM10007880_36700 [Mesorhizobium amorphae]
MDQDQIDDRGNEQPADGHSDNHGDAQALRSPGDVSEIGLTWDEIKDGALTGAMIVVRSLAYGIIDVLIARRDLVHTSASLYRCPPPGDNSGHRG